MCVARTDFNAIQVYRQSWFYFHPVDPIVGIPLEIEPKRDVAVKIRGQRRLVIVDTDCAQILAHEDLRREGRRVFDLAVVRFNGRLKLERPSFVARPGTSHGAEVIVLFVVMASCQVGQFPAGPRARSRVPSTPRTSTRTEL